MIELEQLTKRYGDKLAVDADEIAVECFDGGHVVLRGCRQPASPGAGDACDRITQSV